MLDIPVQTIVMFQAKKDEIQNMLKNGYKVYIQTMFINKFLFFIGLI